MVSECPVLSYNRTIITELPAHWYGSMFPYLLQCASLPENLGEHCLSSSLFWSPFHVCVRPGVVFLYFPFISEPEFGGKRSDSIEESGMGKYTKGHRTRHITSEQWNVRRKPAVWILLLTGVNQPAACIVLCTFSIVISKVTTSTTNDMTTISMQLNSGSN